MKIAIVSEHASPLATLGGVDAGGQNVHVAALACALARLGHSVTVYTRRDAAHLPQRVEMAPGVVVEHVAAGAPRAILKDALLPLMPAFAAYLQRAWQLRPPDVVHSHFWMSGKAALAAARAQAIPVVHTFHALGVEKRRHQGSADSSPVERLAEEVAIVRDADRIIATASSEVFELLRMGAHPRALKIIPCGVDLEQFSPDGPVEARTGRRLRIVALSRLVPRKGVDNVIEAMPALRGAELIVAGGGECAELNADPEVVRLRTLAGTLGVSERVHFRGRVKRTDVPALLRSADIVACTPWYEPFGITALEAMACGVPVVVSAVGGLIDTVIDGVSGMHVPPHDSPRLATTLQSLMHDAERRKALAHAGMERVRSRYAWSRIAAETLEVYRAVATRRSLQGVQEEGLSS